MSARLLHRFVRLAAMEKGCEMDTEKIISELEKILLSANRANAAAPDWKGYYINGVQDRTKDLIYELRNTAPPPN